MNTKLPMLYLWSVIILVVIAWPTPEYNGTVFTWYDKVAHVVLFGIFSYLLAGVLFAEKKIKFNHILILAFVSGVFYSAFCEFIQKFVPGRTVSEYDFFAGVIGVISAMIIFYAGFKNKKT